MFKKSNRISLEEATRLAILGKLPLKENKEVKTESTTVTTADNLTVVDTDDANIVIEPKENAAIDVAPVVCPEAEVPAEEPVEEIPAEEPVDDEVPTEEMFEESKKIEEGEAPLFKKKINKTDIKKVENREIKEEGEAQLFKKKINKTDIKKVENKEVTEEGCGKKKDVKEEGCGEKKEEAPKKKNVINTVDLRKTESKKEPDLNEKLKTKVAEGLSTFVKETYTNGREVKVERLVPLSEGALYAKGTLVMENSTRKFGCKLIPIKENKTFRKYTIKENKLLKITEGKTSKGKEFNLIVRK